MTARWSRSGDPGPVDLAELERNLEMIRAWVKQDPYAGVFVFAVSDLDDAYDISAASNRMHTDHWRMVAIASLQRIVKLFEDDGRANHKNARTARKALALISANVKISPRATH